MRRQHILCLFLMVYVLFVAACSRSDDTPELFIVSPHGSDIRREFQNGFSAWHQEHFGTAARVEWPNIGSNGTGDIVRYMDSQYARRSTCDYDLVFGGGTASFDEYAGRKYLATPSLPEEILGQVPADIHGTPLHGPGNVWIAATLSNFGIVANKQRIAELGLQTPRMWQDLAGPEWFGNLSLADPSKSGSVRTCYDMVLQQYGWEKGWGLLVQFFANTELVREGGSHPADDVGSAQAVAGIVIDFYGRNHITRVGPRIVTFIIPEGGSTIDPDPIAMLKGAPHPELAARFIQFVISPEGQKLWTFKSQAITGRKDGPVRSALGRLSVLPSLYETDSAAMTDPTSPFTSVVPLKADAKIGRTRSVYLGNLIKSALVDNHAALVAARRAIHNAGDPPELMEKLGTLPTIPAELLPSGATEGQPITADKQSLVAELFKPADKSLLERHQEMLKTHWQKEFSALFEVISSEAESRRK